jgi:hypothetical protein
VETRYIAGENGLQNNFVPTIETFFFGYFRTVQIPVMFEYIEGKITDLNPAYAVIDNRTDRLVGQYNPFNLFKIAGIGNCAALSSADHQGRCPFAVRFL